CCGSTDTVRGECAVLMEIPSLTSDAAFRRSRFVMKFTVPSWSSGPQRPQFEYLSIHCKRVSTVTRSSARAGGGLESHVANTRLAPMTVVAIEAPIKRFVGSVMTPSLQDVWRG